MKFSRRSRTLPLRGELYLQGHLSRWRPAQPPLQGRVLTGFADPEDVRTATMSRVGGVEGRCQVRGRVWLLEGAAGLKVDAGEKRWDR